MANKRNLKKLINASCQDLAAICLMLDGATVEPENDKMFQVAIKALQLRAKSSQRVSFAFDKSCKDFASVKEFNNAKRKYFASGYRTLYTEFEENLTALVKEMNALLPKARKEAGKPQAQEA